MNERQRGGQYGAQRGTQGSIQRGAQNGVQGHSSGETQRRRISSSPRQPLQPQQPAQQAQPPQPTQRPQPVRSPQEAQQPQPTRRKAAEAQAPTDAAPATNSEPVKTTAESVGKSSLIMASGTAVSRILGLLRNILLVAALGATGAVADAFDVANKIPNILYAIMAGGVLNAVIVPQVMRAYRSKNAQEHLDKLLTLATTILLAISLLFTVGASVIVGIYTTDKWSSQQLGLAISFAFWCIPQLFFYGLYTLLGQVLNAKGKFGPYMWAPALNNVVSIIGFGLFLWIYGPVATGTVADLSSWNGPKIAFIGIAATLGVVAQALILLVPLYRGGFRWHLRFGYRGIGLRTTGAVAMWTFLALMLDQIVTWVITKIASAAPHAASTGTDIVAGNASYTQALMIYLLPHSLVTVSVATALFTGMSAAAARKDTPAVRNMVSKGLSVISVFTILATSVLMVLSLPATKLLVPSMTPEEVVVISRVVWSLSLGLAPLGAMVLMKWVYYAYEDGKTVFYFQIPVTVSLMAVAFGITRVTHGEWWVFGIGIATSVSNMVAVALRMGGLNTKLGGLDVARLVRLHVQMIVAAGLAGIVGWFVLRAWGFHASDSLAWAALVCVVVGVLMVAIYVLALQIMKVREFSELLNPILKKFTRRLSNSGS